MVFVAGVFWCWLTVRSRSIWPAWGSLERDISRANRLWIEMGMVPDPARYDFDHHLRMIRTLYEPWLLDRPFRFTPEYLARVWNATGFENRNRSKMNVPRDWVFAHRLETGLYALLSKLEATAHWRRKILDILYRPGERRPDPFTEQEVAALHLSGAMSAPTQAPEGVRLTAGASR